MIETINRFALKRDNHEIPLKYFRMLSHFCKFFDNVIVDVGEINLTEEFDFLKPDILVYFTMEWSNKTISSHIVKYKLDSSYKMIGAIYTNCGVVEHKITGTLEEKEDIIVQGILDELYQYPLPETTERIRFTNNSFSYN